MRSTVSYFSPGLALAPFNERLLSELKHSRMYAYFGRGVIFHQLQLVS